MSSSIQCKSFLSDRIDQSDQFTSPRYNTNNGSNRPRKKVKYNIRNNISSSTSTTSLNGSFNVDECLSWSTFQPNYTKMMNDTNLLESCKEVDQELAQISETAEYPKLRGMKSFTTEFAVPLPDPNKVLTWIRYMENYLTSVSPSFNEIRRMSSSELKTNLKEHVEIRRYISKRSKSINEIVRAVERKQMNCSFISDIENRFLALLLKAIEVQCSLECAINSDESVSSIIHGGNKHGQDANFDLDKSFKKLYQKSKDIYKLCDFEFNGTDNDGYSGKSSYLNSPSNTIKTDSAMVEDHILVGNCLNNDTMPYSDIVDKWLDNQIQRNQNTQQLSTNCTIKNVANDFSHSLDNMTFEYEENLGEDEFPLVQEPVQFESKVHEEHLNENLQKQNSLTKLSVVTETTDDINNEFEFIDDYIEDDAWITYPEIQEPLFLNDYSHPINCQKPHVEDIKETEDCIKINEIEFENNEIIEKNLNKSKIIESTPEKSTKLLDSFCSDFENNQNFDPKDFQELIQLCKENVECLRQVLNGEVGKRWFNKNNSKNEKPTIVPHQVVIVEQQCRCSMITRFIAKIIDFLLNWTNIIKNYVLYTFFARTISSFYLIIKYVRFKVSFYPSFYQKDMY